MDQDKILEQKIKQIAEQVYAEKTLKSKYGVTQVPFHTHNGVDSVRVNEKDMIHNIRNYTRLLADTSEVFTLRNVPNISRLSLKGFIANNAGGNPTTKRAIVNGEAYFGRCYTFTGVGSVISVTSTATGVPFIQSSNAMYLSVTGSGITLAVSNRVSVGPFLAIATDGTTEFLNLEILSYDNGSILFDLSIQSGQSWLLQVDLIFS